MSHNLLMCLHAGGVPLGCGEALDSQQSCIEVADQVILHVPLMVGLANLVNMHDGELQNHIDLEVRLQEHSDGDQGLLVCLVGELHYPCFRGQGACWAWLLRGGRGL